MIILSKHKNTEDRTKKKMKIFFVSCNIHTQHTNDTKCRENRQHEYK